jgi:hypothetical protein
LFGRDRRNTVSLKERLLATRLPLLFGLGLQEAREGQARRQAKETGFKRRATLRQRLARRPGVLLIGRAALPLEGRGHKRREPFRRWHLPLADDRAPLPQRLLPLPCGEPGRLGLRALDLRLQGLQLALQLLHAMNDGVNTSGVGLEANGHISHETVLEENHTSWI